MRLLVCPIFILPCKSSSLSKVILMRSLIVISLLLFLPGLAQAQSPLRETQVSKPKVVRTNYDMEALASLSSLSESEMNGRKLFIQRCALCHDPLGQPSHPNTPGPWLNNETVQKLGEVNVQNKIMVGSRRMPGWQYALTQTQIEQIIAYLKIKKLKGLDRNPNLTSVVQDQGDD
jgi:hypothetical protein